MRRTLGATACALLAACALIGPTQRVPGPMPLEGADELPPPDPSASGSAVVHVVRHADPVGVQVPGALDAYPLHFWRKSVDALPGSEIVVEAGGRVELSWDHGPTNVVLSDTCVAVAGDPEADEPLVRLRDVTHARVLLAPSDRIALPGGAELLGDDEAVSGPYSLTRRSEEVVRLTNQSGPPGLLRLRDAALELAAGEWVDVPVPAGGNEPFHVEEVAREAEAGGIPLGLLGAVETSGGERTARVSALDEASVRALGVRVRLGPGDSATLSALRPGETGSPAPPGPEAARPD